MVRSLWSAATGMKAEQIAVDNIANNIANVNTTGYKAQEVQFKSLLYQTLQDRTTSVNGETTPTSAQVGLGVRVSSINPDFKQGAQLESNNPMAMCIRGSGFFQVSGADGNVYYTRDGNFGWTTNLEGQERILTNQNGAPVLDVDGNRISIPDGISTETVSVGLDGRITYADGEGNVMNGVQIALYQFPNAVGLEKMSSNLYAESDASGAAINEMTTDLPVTRSSMAQGYLEGSNVDLADEMVQLIISQRAYELNSRAITTSDTMLDTANQLKR